MSEEVKQTNQTDDGSDGEETTLGEGWYGVSRPAEKKAAPPPPARDGRKKLYTTVAVKEVDAETFSETAKSNRVWWTPEDDELPDADETPFDVDVSGLPINDKYDIGETTRRGDFFVVKAAKDKAGQAVSVKAIDVGLAQMLGQSIDALANEIELLKRCGGDAGVCSGIEVMRTDTSLCLVLESVGGAALNVQLARGADENYTEADARRLARQAAGAVAYVHAQGVVHRDITPDNFLFTAKDNIDQIKLCDFSFAVVTDADLSDAPGGDPEFQAPEIARDEANGKAADVWSLGVLVHLLLAGAPPLHDSNTTRLRQKIGSGRLALGEAPVWPAAASSGALSLLKAVLVVDAAARPTAAAVRDHAYFAATDAALLPTFKKSLREWNETR